MKLKCLSGCVLAAALTAGVAFAGPDVSAQTDDSPVLEQQNVSENKEYRFVWPKSSREGLIVDMLTNADEAVLLKDNKLLAFIFSDNDPDSENKRFYIDNSVLKMLEEGDNSLQLVSKEGPVTVNICVADGEPSDEPSHEESEFVVEQTDFTWDRSTHSDIVISTNSTSKEFVVRCGSLFASSLTNKALHIDEGKITIGSSFLSKLKNGENTVVIVLKNNKFSININVTGSQSQEEKQIFAEQTDYIWDKSDLGGISVKTNSDSHSVTIMKDDKVLATADDSGVHMTSDGLEITADILRKLDAGENFLKFILDDGTVDVNVVVTDEENDTDEKVLLADETNFTWERDSDSGIVIQTNSKSDNFYVKNGRLNFSSSIVNQNLSIENGQIYMGADFLKTLDDGENSLVLVLKEGSLAVTVSVVPSSGDSSHEAKEISADETYFTWDRSDYIGIAVKTNSQSKKVVAAKDGQQLFSNDDGGIYIALGRVGITPKNLKKLDDGENHLVLKFDDGELPVTINVTDKKNVSMKEKNIVAEQTVFVWNRGSGDHIDIKTNSVSENVSVRRSGRLSTVSDSSKITIKDGMVTITPAYLETLSDGKNELSLIFDDGETDIVVSVAGSLTSQISENSFDAGAFTSASSEQPYIFPYTGSALAAEIIAAASVSAAISPLIYFKRKKKKE